MAFGGDRRVEHAFHALAGMGAWTIDNHAELID